MEMTYKIPPYEWQKKLLTLMIEQKDVAVLADMGCVAGDTLVHINLGGNSRSMRIADAFIKQSRWKNYGSAKTRAYLGERIGLHDAVKIIYSGKKDTIKVNLEDRSVRLTHDHEVMTDGGFVPAMSLRQGDLVMIDTPRAVKGEGRKDVNYLYTRTTKHPYQKHKPRGKWGNDYAQVATHRLIAEAKINGTDLKTFLSAVESGVEGLIFLDPEVQAVHHKDHDHKNNAPDNLEVMSHEEHKKHHAEFNQKNLKQGQITYSPVLSVVPYGYEDTYDMVCADPHRNFVANGIVVHNCGKTKGVIDGLRYKFNQYKQVKRTLIFAPLVALYNWQNEWEKQSNIHPSKLQVLHGTSEKKLAIFNKAIASDPQQIIILNYETVLSPKMVDALTKWAPEVMVLDESHYVKNYKAKRSKIIHQLGMNCLHRYIMSGTPMTNSLTDIFMQYKILDNGATFGTNYFTFQRTYMYDENASWSHLLKHFPKWRPRPEMLEVLQAKIYSKAIRVTKDECLDLPPRIQQVYEVELSPSQRKYYKAMEDDYVTFVEESAAKGISVATTALTKALRLQQIVTGYAKLDDGTEIEIEDNPRLSALGELIGALHEQHKVIVWCSFINNYKQIGRLLTEMKIPHVFITGDETLTEKKDNMDAFNGDEKIRIAVCNRKAAGISVNLVSAKYSITYSRNFSLSEELQSGDRNYRGGSEIHDSIIKIDICARDTVDEGVTKSLVDKKDVADKVIEIAKSRRK